MTIIALLVGKEYESLAAMTQHERLTAEEIKDAVESYGRTLTMPPGGLPDDLDFIEIDGAEPRRVAAVMSLWTVEEGQSDLSLEATFTEISPRLWLGQIDNIHVM